MKKKAAYYINVYKDIEQAWRQINQQPTNTLLKDVIEPTLGTLDQVWINDFSYPTSRFLKLIELFTECLWNKLSSSLSRIESGSRKKLNEISEIFSYWTKTLQEYKDKIWDREVGGSFGFEKYMTRIEELKEVCGLVDELFTAKNKLDNISNMNEI